MKLTFSWAQSRDRGQPSSASVWLSIISSIVTIGTPVATVATIFVLHSSNLPTTILAVYVCLLTSSLIIFLLRRESQYRREIRYASALDTLRRASSSLADASWVMINGSGPEDAFRLYLKDALHYLARAYSIVTDSDCRTSIKVVTGSVEGSAVRDVLVTTLCRSGDASPEPLTCDRVSENSDFREILEQNSVYFLSNNLPKLLSSGYQNSHWTPKIIKEQEFGYRATIVWPIARACELAAQPPVANGSRTYSNREVIGFLFVDTMATNAFRAAYDVPIGAAFSQALHLALHKFRESKLEAEKISLREHPQAGGT